MNKAIVNESIEIAKNLRIDANNILCITQMDGVEEMTIKIATLATGVLIMVEAIVAAGAICAELQKIAEAINKQK